MDETRELLKRTAELAADFLESLEHRPVFPVVEADELRRVLGGPLPEQPSDPTEVIEQLIAGAEPGVGRLVGAALILGGLGFLVKTFLHPRKPFMQALHLGPRDRLVAIVIGAVCGFVVGLTSVGSGTFFGLAMLLAYPLTAQVIVGTDIVHAAALLWVAGASHLLHGNVDLHAMAWLLVGSIPGILIGSQMSIKIPERWLRIAFSFVLVLSGIKLVGVPQASLIIVLALAVGAAALLVYGVRLLLGRRPASN